jgi:uncharacterized protein YggT (Ycf19 family)
MTIRRSTEGEVDDDHGHRVTEEVADRGGRRVTTVEEEPVVHAARRDAELVGEEEVTSSSPGSWNVARGLIRMLALWMGVALIAVETLLGFRLAFLLAEANAGNGFVEFIYDVSDPLVEPFQGIIANDTLNSGGVFEPASVIAMVVYFVAAALIIAAVLVTTAGPSGHDSVVTSRSRHRERTAH